MKAPVLRRNMIRFEGDNDKGWQRINFWLFLKGRVELTKMMEEVMEELNKLWMEPKKEFAVVDRHLRGRRQKLFGRLRKNCTCEVPFVQDFDLLFYRFKRDGKGSEVAERSLNRGLKCWWREKHIQTCERRSPEDEVRAYHQPRLERGAKRSGQLDTDTRACQTAEGMEKPHHAIDFPSKNEMRWTVSCV